LTVVSTFTIIFPIDNNSKIFFYLLISLVALVVADGIITRTLIIQRVATESNPFLTAWVESDWLLVVKLIGALSASFVLWRISKIKLRTAELIAGFFVVFYLGVIIWNLSVFLMFNV
jgi:hypothetical protein